MKRALSLLLLILPFFSVAHADPPEGGIEFRVGDDRHVVIVFSGPQARAKGMAWLKDAIREFRRNNPNLTHEVLILDREFSNQPGFEPQAGDAKVLVPMNRMALDLSRNLGWSNSVFREQVGGLTERQKVPWQRTFDFTETYLNQIPESSRGPVFFGMLPEDRDARSDFVINLSAGILSGVATHLSVVTAYGVSIERAIPAAIMGGLASFYLRHKQEEVSEWYHRAFFFSSVTDRIIPKASLAKRMSRAADSLLRTYVVLLGFYGAIDFGNALAAVEPFQTFLSSAALHAAFALIPEGLSTLGNASVTRELLNRFPHERMAVLRGSRIWTMTIDALSTLAVILSERGLAIGSVTLIGLTTSGVASIVMTRFEMTQNWIQKIAEKVLDSRPLPERKERTGTENLTTPVFPTFQMETPCLNLLLTY